MRQAVVPKISPSPLFLVSSDEPTIKSLIVRLTEEEHHGLRRLASEFKLSLAQTMRALIREGESRLWPDPLLRPSILELDRDLERVKEEATARTKAWLQRKKNANQRREARARADLQKLRQRDLRLQERIEEEQKALEAMKAYRAERRAKTAAMHRQIKKEALAKRTLEQESEANLQKAFVQKERFLGRPLTEREKWKMGQELRRSK